MGQVVNVVNGVLCLALDGDRLIFVHVPGVLGVHDDGSVVIDHLDVDAVGLDVGEFDVKGGRGCCTVVVGPDGGERFPALGGGGGGANPRVVALLAVGPGPVDVNHTRPNFLRIGVVGEGVERDGVFHLGFRPLTPHLHLWRSVFHGDVQNQHRLIALFVLNGDFDGVNPVVDPRVIEHARRRRYALVVPCACAVVKGNPEFTSDVAAVLVKTLAGIDENGVLGQPGGFGDNGRWQTTNKQFDASEVVLQVSIGGVESAHIGFPQQLDRADGGVFRHLPNLVHLVGLVGGQRWKLGVGRGAVR